MRRYEAHGHLNVAMKIVLGEFHRVFAGELKKDVLIIRLGIGNSLSFLNLQSNNL